MEEEKMEEKQPENPGGPELQHKISRFHNSDQPRYPSAQEPGIPEMYVNRHKRRKQRSKQDIFDHAMTFLRSKEHSLENIPPEAPPPLDEP